jgi:hypothetical protein
VGALHLGAQQLDLHAEFADALHGGGKFRVGGIDLADLEGAVEGRLASRADHVISLAN